LSKITHRVKRFLYISELFDVLVDFLEIVFGCHYPILAMLVAGSAFALNKRPIVEAFGVKLDDPAALFKVDPFFQQTCRHQGIKIPVLTGKPVEILT